MIKYLHNAYGYVNEINNGLSFKLTFIEDPSHTSIINEMEQKSSITTKNQ